MELANHRNSLVFFGTGPVAAKSLEGILANFRVELVVTKHKASHHKGEAPVEKIASENSLKICFVNDSSSIANQLELLKPSSSVGLVIDFGILIPQDAINYFGEKGIVNSHFSLLPKWRGADPITYSILNGDSSSGVSIMKIVKKLDEGPLIAQKSLKLNNKINSVELTEKLIKLSNNMLSEYLPKYIAGEITPTPQEISGVSYSKKISKQDGNIVWSNPASDIEREIRAYQDWPKSRAKINNTDCIILEASVSNSQGIVGAYEVEDSQIIVNCAKDSLIINRLQPAGKKPMSGKEFIRGYIK